MLYDNYPPGVTGREIEISGPDNEWAETRECKQCDEDTEHECWSHHDHGAYARCTVCDEQHEIPDDEFGPDPDAERDMRYDSMLEYS